MLILCGILFLGGQAIYFTEGQQLSDLSPVKASIWLIWALTLLTLIGTGGGLFLRKSVRALMNDEVTRANRLQAQAMGFWTAAGSALGLYVLTLFEAMSAQQAIHLILTTAIAGALLSFGMLEWRLHRNG